MEILKNVLPQSFKNFLKKYKYLFNEIRKGHKKHLKILLKNNEGKSISIDNEKKWIKKLCKLTYSNPELFEIGIEFANSQIEILQERNIQQEDVIVICVVKNDIIKLKRFISHYRKLGIKKFIILDNNSDDGSVQWLLKQDDVIILQTKMKYTSSRRVGWINRIIAHYGDNRWYIIVDSDEFLVYNDCENKNIQDLIKYCKENNMVRLKAIMLDMYANYQYYINGNIADFYEQCVYFDKKYTSKDQYSNLIYGGPRERVFNVSACLTKYPLFYFRKNDIQCNSHYLYPYNENIRKECNLVLKHYKFLPGELEKYKKIAKEGNYYNGSQEYKSYINVIEKKKVLDFMFEDTEKYINSNSLAKINVYKKITWK